MSMQNLPSTSFSFVQSNLAGSQFIDDHLYGNQDETIINRIGPLIIIYVIKILELLKYVYYLWFAQIGDAASPSVRSITSSPATSGYHGGNKPIQHLASLGPTVTSSSGVYGKYQTTRPDYSNQDNSVIIFLINVFLFLVSTDILQSIQVQQAILTAKVDLCLNILGSIQKGQRIPEQHSGKFNLPIATVEDANILLLDITDNRDSRNDLVGCMN